MRPDLHQTLLDYGHKEEGRKGFFNQWVIDSLVEDDVVVVDLFDKIFQGTYVGGNLSTAIKTYKSRSMESYHPRAHYVPTNEVEPNVIDPGRKDRICPYIMHDALIRADQDAPMHHQNARILAAFGPISATNC